MTVWHMSGAGNDFMVMDARNACPDFSALSKHLCQMTGADGFLAVDNSEVADFKMHFYNSDGSRGEMCGNGARCLCRFAYDNQIAPAEMTVETDAGLVPGVRLSESTYRVKLNLPSVLDLHRKPGVAYVEEGEPGIPHAVVEVPELTFDMADGLRETALQLLEDKAFPKGVNVNFYTRLSTGGARVLTFERGVDDYTLACGTGCAAVACVLWAEGKIPNGNFLLYNRGGVLAIDLTGENGEITSLNLEGPTEILKVYTQMENPG